MKLPDDEEMKKILAEIMKTFGDRLKTLRKQEYRTQAKFAEAMKVSIETVKKWEGGKVLPDTNHLFMISHLLDCDIDYLTGRIDIISRAAAASCEYTGLSEKAVKTLRKWHNKPLQPFIRVLNQLLEKNSFTAVLAAVWNYCSSIQEHKSKDTTGAISITVETGLPTNKEINLWTASHKFTKCIENLSQPF